MALHRSDSRPSGIAGLGHVFFGGGRNGKEANLSGQAADTPKLRIGFVLAKSFTLSPFALFVDILSIARDEGARYGRVHVEWDVLASSRHLIRSSCGVQISPTSDLYDPQSYDFIVVVGGRLNDTDPIDDQTVSFLRAASSRKVTLIGLCTGTFILAAAGLMKNHKTCVSWLYYNDFHEQFPEIDARADRIFNLDRSRGSCAGGSSAADMAAAIVRHYVGKEAERHALEVLQIEKARSPLDIQPRRPLAIDTSDSKVRAALILMETNTERTLNIEMLAAAVGVSRRHLERLFNVHVKRSPADIYRRVRLERAKMLLAQTGARVVDVAIEVGFESASHFTKSFKQVFGCTPRQWQQSARE